MTDWQFRAQVARRRFDQLLQLAPIALVIDLPCSVPSGFVLPRFAECHRIPPLHADGVVTINPRNIIDNHDDPGKLRDLMAASYEEKYRIGQLQARYTRVTGQNLSDEDATVLLQTKHDHLAGQVIIPEEASENINGARKHLRPLAISMVLAAIGAFVMANTKSWLYLPAIYLVFGASIAAIGIFFSMSLYCFMYMENSGRGRRTLYYYPLWSLLAFPLCAVIVMVPLKIFWPLPRTIVETVSSMWPANVPLYYLPILVLSVVVGYNNTSKTPIRMQTLIFTAIGMVLCFDGHYWAYPAAVSYIVGQCLAVKAKMSS